MWALAKPEYGSVSTGIQTGKNTRTLFKRGNWNLNIFNAAIDCSSQIPQDGASGQDRWSCHIVNILLKLAILRVPFNIFWFHIIWVFSKTFHYPDILPACKGWLLDFLWMSFQTFCSGRFDWQHNMVTLSLLNDVALNIINRQKSGRTWKECFVGLILPPSSLRTWGDSRWGIATDAAV